MPRYMGGLRFRNFEIFNLALLARQTSRILDNPSFLGARLLKVIYFPGSSLFGAQVGSHPSQVWRTIIEGKDFLNMG